MTFTGTQKAGHVVMHAPDMQAPLFIIGCPRSGTTILLQTLAAHRDLAWVSHYYEDDPTRPMVNLLHRVYNPMILGELLYKYRWRLRLPIAVEPWKFWSRHIANFRWPPHGARPPRSHTEADMSESERRELTDTVRRLCKLQGRRVFLSKYTDLPRIRLLLSVFPKARFLHLLRDGRSVATSYTVKMKTGRFATWDERDWWVSGWPAALQREWQGVERCPIELAAFQWRHFVTLIRDEASALLPEEQYCEIRYDAFIENPQSAVARMLKFAGLPYDGRMGRFLSHSRLTDRDQKWRDVLSTDEHRRLEEILPAERVEEILSAS